MRTNLGEIQTWGKKSVIFLMFFFFVENWAREVWVDNILYPNTGG